MEENETADHCTKCEKRLKKHEAGPKCGSCKKTACHSCGKLTATSDFYCWKCRKREKKGSESDFGGDACRKVGSWYRSE